MVVETNPNISTDTDEDSSIWIQAHNSSEFPKVKSQYNLLILILFALGAGIAFTSTWMLKSKECPKCNEHHSKCVADLKKAHFDLKLEAERCNLGYEELKKVHDKADSLEMKLENLQSLMKQKQELMETKIGILRENIESNELKLQECELNLEEKQVKVDLIEAQMDLLMARIEELKSFSNENGFYVVENENEWLYRQGWDDFLQLQEDFHARQHSMNQQLFRIEQIQSDDASDDMKKSRSKLKPIFLAKHARKKRKRKVSKVNTIDRGVQADIQRFYLPLSSLRLRSKESSAESSISKSRESTARSRFKDDQWWIKENLPNAP